MAARGVANHRLIPRSGPSQGSSIGCFRATGSRAPWGPSTGPHSSTFVHDDLTESCISASLSLPLKEIASFEGTIFCKLTNAPSANDIIFCAMIITSPSCNSMDPHYMDPQTDPEPQSINKYRLNRHIVCYYDPLLFPPFDMIVNQRATIAVEIHVCRILVIKRPFNFL